MPLHGGDGPQRRLANCLALIGHSDGADVVRCFQRCAQRVRPAGQRVGQLQLALVVIRREQRRDILRRSDDDGIDIRVLDLHLGHRDKLRDYCGKAEARQAVFQQLFRLHEAVIDDAAVVVHNRFAAGDDAEIVDIALLDRRDQAAACLAGVAGFDALGLFVVIIRVDGRAHEIVRRMDDALVTEIRRRDLVDCGGDDGPERLVLQGGLRYAAQIPGGGVVVVVM